jgi:FKBP-type peptidyl-prolyl cis-trans isomerase
MSKTLWIAGGVGALIIIAVIALSLNRTTMQNSPAEKLVDNQQPSDTQDPDDSFFDVKKDEPAQSLTVRVLKEGTGQEAKAGDRVTVHYTGWLTDGTKFDSSVDRGQPFAFTLGAMQVIQGWEQGVLGMKTGEKRKLTIPPELGYGSTGTPGGPIPPDATLIFEVELLKIN